MNTSAVMRWTFQHSCLLFLHRLLCHLEQIKGDVSRRGIADDASEKLMVFLRIRPLTDAEKERGEEQVKSWGI